MPDKYTVIVGGATSGLGIAATRLLLAEGHRVIALMREGSRRISVFDQQLSDSDCSRLEIVYLDFKDYDSLHHSADAFINFAWEGTTGSERFDPDLQSRNLENAEKAMRHAKSLGCKVYVDAGSQAEYGWQRSVTTEESLCDPFSDYGRAKLESWLRGRQTAKDLGIAYVHPRIFSTYGETENDAAMIPYVIGNIILGKPVLLTECTQWWNYLYRDDAAMMICRLMFAHICMPPAQEAYNIGSLDTRVLRSFIQEIADTVAIDCEIVYGAHRPERLLSLRPDMTKTLSVVGDMDFTPFAVGIHREYLYIKNKLSHD